MRAISDINKKTNQAITKYW